jgi:hypothetical protein
MHKPGLKPVICSGLLCGLQVPTTMPSQPLQQVRVLVYAALLVPKSAPLMGSATTWLYRPCS